MRPKGGDIGPVFKQNAMDFIEEMRRRGALVVFTLVPYRKNREVVRREAEELGVPCVAPELSGLTTFDGSHLTPESGDRFATSFFKALRNLPEMRKMTTERSEK
jgi:hypothetical protein